MPEQEGGAGRLSPALITAIAALVTAAGGVYVAVREPSAQKVSLASEEISKASQDEHDQLVKLVQAVDDLSKNVAQNHDTTEVLRTYVESSLLQIRRTPYLPGTSPAAPVASAPPAAPAPKPVAIPRPLARPLMWNAATNTLQP
jgi:hypothetical protein